MDSYVALCTVNFYNEISEKTETEHVIITGVITFTEAMAKLEDYYSDELNGVEIKLIEGPFAFVDEKTLKTLETSL